MKKKLTKLPRTKTLRFTVDGNFYHLIYGLLHTPKNGEPTSVPPTLHKLTFATLNAKEEAAWRCAYRDARTRLKYGDLRADGHAWKKVQRQFPRLRKYDAVWNFASEEVD